MDSLRALVVILGLVAPATGFAAPGEFSDPVTIFASCTGRLSAEMEHRWLHGTDPAEVTRHRAAMIELLDAVREPEQGPDVLARRIEAKLAQAALLQRAAFSTDAREAQLARNAALSAKRRCLILIAE